MIKDPKYRLYVGSIVMLYVLVMYAFNAFGTVHIDTGVLNTLIGFSSYLLSAGIIKQHKAFRQDEG